MKKVTIVDYGMGNVFSVASALDFSGAETVLSSDPEIIATSDRLILPGVGAFADGMSEIRLRGLIPPILRFISRERPFLGICLGMQMLFDSTEEFGTHEGIGIIAGEVRTIPELTQAGGRRKLPHIGWNKVTQCSSESRDPLLTGLEEGLYCYFVHSFAASPANNENLIACCDYDGFAVSAVVRKNYVWGCQFHPEKSGERGLELLRNFLIV